MKKFSWKTISLLVFLTGLLLLPANAATETIELGQQIQFFSSVTVDHNEIVNGDVVTFFGHTEIRGQVKGDVVGIFSSIALQEGHVQGDVVSIFQSVALTRASAQGDVISILGGVEGKDHSHISGDAIAIMGSGLRLEDTTVEGSHIDVLGGMPFQFSGIGLLAALLAIIFLIKQIVAFILGVIAILVFPERFERMAEASFDEVGRKTLIGLLVNAGAWILILILAISVVGAPLISVVIPTFMLMEFGANTTVKIAFGRKIARSLHKEWGSMIELLIGTLLFILLEITVIGKVFTFLFKLMGLGQIVDSRFGDTNISKGKGGMSIAPGEG
ncbi:hypothetical protein [Tindallia californiensis]|uniref:Polymer-forming protein n=1 Tax=Tindallia californiensis TaxID=159292 RepID=A0A1H3L8R7_9FIRM|nr:hypothetical protein [Tindallia californiensis]SDY60324.1 hypothetical protein SAMN05192546_10398 [Tindallia californiensis]